MKKKLLFILGTAYCGSTLLSLILNSHPRCFNMGEISNLPRLYKNKKKICSICQKKCDFWDHKFSQKELEMLSLGLSNSRISKYIPLKVEKFFRELVDDPIFKPYSLIASKTDADVIIDSTKSIYWIKNELDLKELNSNQFDIYVLHLLRDGRAIVNSYLKKRKHLTIEQISHLWKNRVEANEVFFNEFPSERKLKVTYEMLASRPTETMQKICQFLDIDFDSDILKYWQHEHHIISANRGTKSLVKKYQNPNDDRQEEKTNFAIKLDLRWHKELDKKNLEKFYQIIGDRNKPYEWNS